MSAEKNKGILLEDDVDDFETISHSPDKSYHRKPQQHSFEIIEPKHIESDHKYHGSNNVTQYFGSEIGLFSKFTGMRNVSEEHRPHGSPTKEQMREEEERESLTLSERNKQNAGTIVSQGIDNSLNKNKFGYKLAILTVIFSIQFASSVEMVYITPYFIKLALSDWVDTTFWMIPVIVTTLLTPLVSIMVKHNTYQRAVQIGFMIVSLIGCFLFAYIDELVHYFAINYEQRIITLTWMGLVAFCLIDVSNEMILLTQNKIIDESLQPDNSIANQADVASSLGKIFGFFFGSLQALQFDFYKILQNNMDFCFFAAGVLMAISLVLICLFHPTIPVSSREPTVSLKHLQLVHFLPISNKFKTASLRMKTLIAAHFFGASTILMLSVYTTSWIGQDVLRGDPDRPAHTLENRLFDLGVSWGSFALMLTSVVVMFTGFVINRMANKPNKPVLKGFFILSQLLAAIGLLDCVFIHDYSDVFVVLPLTGFAFQTFQIIPELIADILEKREKGSVTGDYKQLLSLNLFYAQALTFVFIPFIFLLFPDISDNLWGILVAGAGGVISAVFALFV